MKSKRSTDEICYAEEIKYVLASDGSRISSRSDLNHRGGIYPIRKDDFSELQRNF